MSIIKKIVFLLLFFMNGSFCAYAAEYPVSVIPDSLLKKANMVKRMEQTIIEIKGPGKARIYRKYAYTILNEAGERYAAFYDYYDKFRAINSITGTLYDAMGNKLKQVKKKDIEDVSDRDEMNLMTDLRFKYHNFYYKNYPFTIEYEEEVELNGIERLPTWSPLPEPYVSLENSKVIVVTPKEYSLRYKEFNYDRLPVINEAENGKTYLWELKSTMASEGELYSPEWNEISPTVLIAPTDFEIEGYKGKMDSWLHYGQFYNQLNLGRDILPGTTKQKVHELTDGLNSDREKVKVLYGYLQQNTRYISIQLGIGGLQPFDATFVANKKYGDCKALSNFMCAMLKEAGIKANTVLIEGGDDATPVVADFPSDQFNHVIACVPMQKDTVWLECTSQNKQAGFMGSFTGNRNALLIAEDGGYLVSTPHYTSADNLQLRKINATIDADGNLVVKVNTRFTGQQQELPHNLMHVATKEEREKYMNSRINLPTYKVLKIDYYEINGPLPIVDEYLEIESPNYASITGKRLFVIPNLFNKSSTKFSKEGQRKTPIEFRYAFKDVDTINITIPPGYTTESMPKDVSIKNVAGIYNISFKVNDNKIEVIRVNERTQGRYPASGYDELVKLYDEMYKADRARIVLVKKEG